MGAVRAVGASLVLVAALLVSGVVAGPVVAQTTSSALSAGHPTSDAWRAAGKPSDPDAPDPDIVLFGTEYYAYTTGTQWGNNLGVLESSHPDSGFHTINGKPYGSTALPQPPSWQWAGHETSPSVAEVRGLYVMFYDAILNSNHSLYCLSVATAKDPTGPFVDHSTHPFGPCSASWNGSIDPSIEWLPHGQVWLLWKENDSGRYGSAEIWAERLSDTGLGFAAGSKAHVLLTQNSGTYHWETTTEDPALVWTGSTYELIFSAGRWTNSTYSEAAVACPGGASVACTGTPARFLTTYASVSGPGGGMVFQDASHRYWLAFAGWHPNCVDGTNCPRDLYVTTIHL